MINYLKRKFLKYKARRVFSEYEYTIVEFELPLDGKVQCAQWLNPLEKAKEMTQSRVNFFRKFIKAGDFAIDIGAHTGDTTIPMALAAGASGKILALDPNPHIFKILEVNSRLNKGKTNIEPLCCAATVSDGEFYYSSSEASFNNGGISPEKNDRHGQFFLETKIKGINVENHLRKNYAADLSRLSLIKIDTEGYDKDVIKSLGNIIRECKPFLIFECFGKLSKDERNELYDGVASHGYTLFYFEDFTEETLVEQIERKDMNRWKHFDIYATPSA